MANSIQVDNVPGDGELMSVVGRGVVLAAGDTVPTDATAGYETGCIFIHMDGGDGTALYVNEGTSSSCNFNAITVGA